MVFFFNHGKIGASSVVVKEIIAPKFPFRLRHQIVFSCHHYRPQTKFVKVMFLHPSVSHSVHGGVSRPTPRGGVEGSGQGGVSRPTPGGRLRCLAGGSPGPHPGGRLRGLAGGVLQAHMQGEVEGWAGGVSRPTARGCTPACTEADTPPSRWLLLRAVRILLECILVCGRIY